METLLHIKKGMIIEYDVVQRIFILDVTIYKYMQ